MKHNLAKNLILGLFLAAVPGLALANVRCAEDRDSIVPCQVEEAETISSQSEINKEYSAIALYYSGSILHNKALLNEINPPQKSPSPTGFAASNDLNPEIETVFAEDTNGEDTNGEDLYSEIGAKFKSLKTVQKKDIQKCLRYGSYTAKVDGIWGYQTFEAIIDFKNEIEVGNESQSDSMISKIKGVFSNKETCYEFINEIFAL